MRSAELMGTFAIGQSAALSLGGFYQSIDDRIVLQFDEADGLFFNDNTGEARVTGFDAEIDAGMSSGVNATASYTYQDGEDRATGEWLVNSPKHLAKLNIQAPITHPSVMGGLEMQYMSKRRTAADNEVDGNFITNVSVNAKRIFGGIDVAASVMNLMDEEYADPAAANLSLDSVEQNGRNFRLRLGYGF
jgi:iron complex outermembrane receptor protein